MRHRVVAVMVLVMMECAGMYAQTPNIERYVSMVESGQVEVVREELPSLLKQYPNDPGVLYVQALLTTDGADAVRQYQKIVDTYPNSEWADDALYRVYKFYYAIGLYRTAESKLDQLRTNYPNSRYIAGAALSERMEQETAAQRDSDDKQQTQELPVATEPPIAKEQPGETPVPTPAPRAVEARALPERFTLQVGAYAAAANANRQKSFFDYHNYPADVASKMLGNKKLYVVYVGTFATEKDARRAGEELRRSFNIEYIIVTR